VTVPVTPLPLECLRRMPCSARAYRMTLHNPDQLRVMR
jgi:hypothetical protein